MSELQKTAGTAPGDGVRRTARWNVRGILRQIHLWVGLALGIPFVVLGLTGSYLVYHDEIVALLAGGEHFEVTTAPARGAEEIVAAALTTAPAGFAASAVSLPGGEGEPATVRVGPDGAGFRDPRVVAIVVDPATLAVLGTRTGGMNGLTRLMHDLHGHLMLPGRDGRQVVGWLGVAMLVIGVSGLVLWWPRPHRLMAALTVKRGARGYRLHRDLHGSVGFWSLSVFVIVSFTGVYIAFPQTLSALVGTFAAETPSREPLPALRPVEGVAPMGLGEMARLAGEAVPDARLRMVAMPFRPGQPARAMFALSDAAQGAPSITVLIDPWRGRVLDVRDPRTFGAGEAIAAWQRPLHEGGGLGPVWRLLVFLSGLLPLLFAVTGVSMWLLRRRARRVRRPA